jgi:hypothetical protein
MSNNKTLERLLEEWSRTVEDFFHACLELERLSNLGEGDIKLRSAEYEARELKVIATRARHRYQARLRSQAASSRNTMILRSGCGGS